MKTTQTSNPRFFATAVSAAAVALLAGPYGATDADAGGMTCRKVTAAEATAEGRNALKGSRVKCGPGEFLTGGTCYPSVRPEDDGSCQTSAMGMIQIIADYPDSTQEAFFTCLQTGGTDCPVAERTKAMAICCRYLDDDEATDE